MGGAKYAIAEFVTETITDLQGKDASVKPNVILVMASRGMGQVQRWFVGSVSDYCVHNCPCPVVVVKSEQAEHDKNA